MKKQMFVRLGLMAGIVLSLLASCAPRTLDAFYLKYRHQGESERIALPMALLKPLGGLLPKEDRQELNSVLGKMKSMKVMTLELKEQSVEKARGEMQDMMARKSFEELMTVNSEGELVKIMMKRGAGNRKEVILVAMSGTDVSILDFKLRLSDSDIENLLSETMDMHQNNRKKNSPDE